MASMLKSTGESNRHSGSRHKARLNKSQLEQAYKPMLRASSESRIRSKGSSSKKTHLPALGDSWKNLSTSSSSLSEMMKTGSDFSSWGSPEQSPEQQLRKQLSLQPRWEQRSRRKQMSNTFSGAVRSHDKASKEDDPFADWGSPERSPLDQFESQAYLRLDLQEQRPTLEVIANCFADILASPVEEDSNQLNMGKYADWGFAASLPEDQEAVEEADQHQEQEEQQLAINCKGVEDLKGGRESAASTRVPSAASSLVDSRPGSTAFCGAAYSRSNSRCQSRGYPALQSSTEPLA